MTQYWAVRVGSAWCDHWQRCKHCKGTEQKTTTPEPERNRFWEETERWKWLQLWFYKFTLLQKCYYLSVCVCVCYRVCLLTDAGEETENSADDFSSLSSSRLTAKSPSKQCFNRLIFRCNLIRSYEVRAWYLKPLKQKWHTSYMLNVWSDFLFQLLESENTIRWCSDWKKGPAEESFQPEKDYRKRIWCCSEQTTYGRWSFFHFSTSVYFLCFLCL